MRSFAITTLGDRLAIDVPDDLAFFAGHFPGAPIVPGAALLQLALQQVGGDAPAVTLERVRFLEPVGPGARLALRISRSGERAAFGFDASGKNVAQGSLVPATAPPATARHATPADATLPDPRRLLPHQPPAVLLTALVAHSPLSLHARAQLRGDSPFRASAWASAGLIEAAAQAAAAHGGLLAQARGAPGPAPQGYLVGIKAALLARELPTDATFAVAVERTGSAGPLAIYAARVSHGVNDLMRGELSVFVKATEAPA